MKGGGQDTPIVVAEVVERTQEKDQGITTPLSKKIVLQMSVEAKGHTWPQIEMKVVLLII